MAPQEPANWISGNYYLGRADMDNNAIKFFYVMSRLGCSYNSILGMLANIERESTINPGIWESLTPYWRGYGLTQWTPYTKYTDWAGSDWEGNGQKECERIIYESQNGLQWFDNPASYLINLPTQPPITLAEYLQSDLAPELLADYWLLYYEHPAESGIVNRHENHRALCEYYNELLGGVIPPVPPVPPTPTFHNKFIYMINKRKFMKRRGLIWR